MLAALSLRAEAACPTGPLVRTALAAPQVESAIDLRDACAERLTRRVLQSEQLAKRTRVLEVSRAHETLSLGATHAAVLEHSLGAVKPGGGAPRVLEHGKLGDLSALAWLLRHERDAPNSSATDHSVE